MSATPTPTPSASTSTKPVKASDNLDAVTVTGAYGKEPKVSFKTTPWAIDKTRTEVLKAGSGPKSSDSGNITVNYYGVNARTGEKFDDSWSRGQTVTFDLGQVIPGFTKGLTGQQAGSRVVIAIPSADGYADGNPQAGIEKGDTLVFVVDIEAIQLTEPSGDEVAARTGLPTVSGALDAPKVTIPDADPPTELVAQPLIKGSGPKVAETDTITVQYQAVSWKTGKVVDQSYGQAAQTGQLSSLIAGWQQGLKGVPVGSRMLLVVPPDLAYPDGSSASPQVEKGDTLVYVIDVLFTQQAQ